MIPPTRPPQAGAGAAALAAAPALAHSARLERLRAAPRKPGTATFFYWDAHFRNDAVKVLPGEYFVHDEDILITTTLGSCIAACLWDRERRIGGMNHFMLPDGSGQGQAQSGGRYGGDAMELLINALLARGASRQMLEAKVFGGGAVLAGMGSANVGERNTRFVLDYLQTERIPIISRDVLDNCPRKVCFFPASGKALVKRLAPAQAAAVAQHDGAASARSAPALSASAGGGALELF